MFTELLRLKREKLNIPQKRLAAILDIDTPMYSRIERGKRSIKKEQVIALAKVLEINEDDLVNIWFAERIYQLIKNEPMSIEILDLVKKQILSTNEKF